MNYTISSMLKVYEYLWFAIIAFFGLCIGSFLNVVIYRMPLDKSIVSPGSSCPKCANSIAWYDNIPVISYILLRGKCRKCSAPISIRYPAVEALVGALTVGLFYERGLNLQSGIMAILIFAMVAVAFIDADHMIILDEFSLGGAAIGLLLSLIPKGITPLDAALGAAGGAASLATIRFVHMKISGIEGMGMGDIKLIAAIGAFLGWYSLPFVLLLSTLPGLLIAGGFLIVKGKSARTPIPLGTFLALGTVIYVFIEPYWIEYLASR